MANRTAPASPGIQLELPLFEPAPFDRLCSQEDAVSLTITVNPRLRTSWRMSACALTGHRTVQIPPWLDSAPDVAKRALIEWAKQPLSRRSRRGSTACRRQRELERFIFQHTDSHQRPYRRAGIDPVTFGRNHAGTAWDLREVFDSINHRVFDGRLRALVRWGSVGSLTSYHMQNRDREGTTHDCITIAGAYDHCRVPRFAIEGVMHHEMLHIVIPPTARRERRCVHGRQFREAERNFPQYRLWREWETLFLRSLRTRIRREQNRKRTR